MGSKVALFLLLDFRPSNGCVVYPEGHRFKEKGSLPLKTGVMEVAYNLKRPCQCVLTLGKVRIVRYVNSRRSFSMRLTSR